MNKILPLIIGLFLVLTSFTKHPYKKDEDKKSVKVSKIVITKLSEDKKKKVSTHTLTYGKSGFVEKVDISIIETFGIEGEGLIKMFNKEEKSYVYNSDNQLVEEYDYKYYGKEKKLKTKVSYSYDNLGYIVSSIYENGGKKRPKTYEYDENCVLKKANREMPKIDFHIVWNYKYNEKGILTGLHVKSVKKKLNSSTFLFDNNKNPVLTMFPEKYCAAFPEEYNVNNPLKILEIGAKYSYKDTYKYEYNSNKYPKKIVNKHYEKKKLKSTITSEYFYEKMK